MERKSSGSNDIDYMTLDFIEKHKLTPEMAQVARAMVMQNCLIVDSLFSKGFVNQEALTKAMEDDELLGQYAQMVEAEEKGLNDSFDLLYKDIADDPVEFCGWLLFQNELLQARAHLDFIPKSEGDYKYDDFITRN